MGAAAIPLPAVMEFRSFDLRDEPPYVTLLELIETVSSVTQDDREVVATVLHMLRGGSVRLRGSFRGEPIEQF